MVQSRLAPHRTAGRRVSLDAMARLTFIALALFAACRERRGRGAAVVAAAEPVLAVAVRRQPRRGGLRRRPRARHLALERAAAGQRERARRHAARGARAGRALFGPERSAPNFVTPLVTYGLDRVVGARHPPARVRAASRCGRASATRKGAFGPPRTISTFGDTGFPPSLAGPNGSLAAWIAKASHGRRIVRAAVKSRGRFRHPFTLRSRGRANDVVAGQALGVMFVAWERAGVVEARVELAGRRVEPGCSGSARARAVRDHLRGRPAPAAALTSRGWRRRRSLRSCASPFCLCRIALS